MAEVRAALHFAGGRPELHDLAARLDRVGAGVPFRLRDERRVGLADVGEQNARGAFWRSRGLS